MTTHNSPALARNPTDATNVVVASRIDAPFFSCALHLSFDGGKTWSETIIPFPAGEEQPPRCFAPDVAFGAAGELYVSFATLAGTGNRPNAAWVSRSDDGGRSLSMPVRAARAFPFQVRLVTDPGVAGRVWLTWVQAAETATLGFPEPGYPVMVARSDDGGLSWGEVVRVSPPSRGRVLAPTMVAGSDGRLALVYLDLGDDALDYHGAHAGAAGDPYAGTWSLVLARSPDGGRSWTEVVVEPALVPTERIVAFTPPVPALAVDERRDRLYVAYQDGRLGSTDVWVWARTTEAAPSQRLEPTTHRRRTGRRSTVPPSRSHPMAVSTSSTTTDAATRGTSSPRRPSSRPPTGG